MNTHFSEEPLPFNTTVLLSHLCHQRTHQRTEALVCVVARFPIATHNTTTKAATMVGKVRCSPSNTHEEKSWKTAEGTVSGSLLPHHRDPSPCTMQRIRQTGCQCQRTANSLTPSMKHAVDVARPPSVSMSDGVEYRLGKIDIPIGWSKLQRHIRIGNQHAEKYYTTSNNLNTGERVSKCKPSNKGSEDRFH